ncbi:TPA: tail protein X [Pseudomonas aeruginosa]
MAAVAIAHQNDTVEALCWRHYGRTGGVTEAVLVRESEINQKGKARKLWDIEEGTGI